MRRRSFSNIVSGAIDDDDKRWVDNHQLYTQSEIVRAAIKLFRQLGEDTQTKRIKTSHLPRLDRYHRDGINGKTIQGARDAGLLDMSDLKHIYDSYDALREDLKRVITVIDMDNLCNCKDCRKEFMIKRVSLA